MKANEFLVDSPEDLFNEKDLVLKKINGKTCFYKCKEPGGSIVGSVLILAIVQIIVPTMLDFLTGMIPLTVDALLDEFYVNISIVINYIYSPSYMDLAFFFVGGLFAGLVSLKPLKALFASLAFIAVSIVAFFFFTFFIIGGSVDYWLFFMSMINVWGLLKFAAFTILPLMLGYLIAKIFYAKKSCYVANNVSVING